MLIDVLTGALRVFLGLAGVKATDRGFEKAKDFYREELPGWNRPSVARPSLKGVENGWKDTKSVDAPCTSRGAFCSGINKPANLVR
jgi:hypothetical protein